MKNKNLLNLVGREESYEQTRRGRHSLESIVSRFSLVSLICLCMLTLGVGNAWGETITYTFSSKSWAASPANWTSNTDGSSFESSGSARGVANNGVNGACTSPTTFSNVSSISVVASSNTTGGKVAIKIGGTQIANKSIANSNNATYTYNSSDYSSIASLSGNVQIVVTKPLSKTVWVKSITITYSAASCTTNPTVGAGSNSSVTSTTATVSCSSGISSLGSAGCSISSYGFVIGTSTNPAIGGSGVTKHEVGTSYTTTGTSFSKDLTGLSASTTYYVRPYATNGNGTGYGTQTSFTTPALPKYTITYNAGSGSCGTSTWTQGSAGASTTLPTATPSDGCSTDGWAFAGWCTDDAGDDDDNTTSPGTILTGSYTPTGNITLYAVYTKTSGGGGGGATLTKMVTGNTLSNGDKIVVVANGTDIAMYQETTNTSYVQTWDCSTLNATTVSADDKNWWTVTAITGGFSLGDGTNGYLYSSSNNLYCGNTQQAWTLSDLEDGTFKLQSDGRNLSYRSDLATTKWRMGGTTYGTSGQTILDIYKYSTGGGGGTTYYMTNLTCSAPTNFPNDATIFIQAHSTSAWSDANNDCVKAWFHSYGGSEAAQPTYWLFDATGGDSGKKLFAAIVPATGDLPYLDIQRFSHNCNSYKNKNGGCSYSDAAGSNTIRSTGKSDTNNAEDNYIFWNATGVTMELWGSPDSWAAKLADVTDQGGGEWSGTYNNFTPSGTSATFKIKTNYNGWIGNTGSNDDATLSGMIVGSTYNVTATLDITDHSLVMSKTFVKGTVHFDLQGHGSAISDLTNVMAGATISAPTPAPTAAGFMFQGWYKEPACTNAWDFANDVMEETMTLYAKWGEARTFTLLTNAANLYDGDEIVLVSYRSENSTYYALSTNQRDNNREAISSGFSVDGSTVTVSDIDEVQVINVEASESYWMFNVGTNAYLYAASSSSNHLKTSTSSTAGNNGKWSVAVSSNIATIVSHGTNTHNTLNYNYNNNNPAIFSCYQSPTANVKIYHTEISEPTLTVTANLSEFTYERGHGPSAAQSFTVKGVLLSNNVTVTAPTNYEVCLTKDGTYTSSVELSKGSGTLSTTTIYVRLASGLGTGDYDGNIRINSTGATEKTVAVEGTVTCSTPVLSFASPVVTTTADAANFTNTLTVTGNEGNGAITYTSSDAFKASVDPATGEVDVKAITAEGTPVTITATVAAVAGANCQNTASASYTITIGAKITWHVNGSVYTEGDPTTIVASGGSIEVLPTPPDGTATCGDKVFVGWTTDDDYAHATNAPGDLFSTVDGAPSISGNTDFYAVFATAGAVSSTTFKPAVNAEDLPHVAGQKIVIVDHNRKKILQSNFTVATRPTPDGNGCITVSSNQIWELTEQDEAGYWVIKCGNVQLGVNRSTALTSGYQACGNYDTYASSWVINHTSIIEGASVDSCFYLWNWYSDGEDEGEEYEIYNLLSCRYGTSWVSEYTAEITSSNKNYYAMYIYVPATTYTNYAVTCTTPHVVTVHTGGHGSVAADPIYVVNNGSTTLTLTPDAGYQCSSVTLNSGTATEGTLSGNTYTLTNITSDVDLTATFTKAPVYNVIFDAGQGKIVGQNATSVTLTEVTRSYGVTSPRASSCSDQWTFAYWSTEHPESESNTTVPARTVDANQKYVPSADNEHLYAIYTKSTGTPVYSYGTDAIYRSTTGVPDQTGTTIAYTDWSNKAVTTAARYAGNSAGDNGVIQLRDKNPSGIVSTTSGGTLSQVKIYWDSHTTTAKPRSIDIYGYNTAYTSSADVYGGSGTTPKGTKLGTVTYDSENPTNTFNVTGSYAYVGLRPKEGALFLSQVDIKWITAVSGITTYYCHKPTCDECVDPTFGFETPSITLSCPRVGTYTNTFTTNNTNDKTYSSSNTSVATVNNSGEVTLVGKGTTIISVHQNRMTSGATKYCAVDDSYELTVIEAGVEVVEVTNTNDIIIEHDFGGNTNVLIDQLTLHEEGNKADEVFFSKYFEATGSVKLVALYNGTGKSHDPSKYRIRVQSPSAGVRHIVNVGDYVTEWPNGKELIFYSWDTDLESDINVMDCVYEKNDNGEIDMSGWIAVPWTVYSGTVPALLFGGDDAIVLEEYDGSQWNILDIIGALTADGKKADDSNATPKASISWGDHDAWYCANGRELNGDDSDYPLATVRCLLVRKDDVLSGAATRNTTTGNLGTGYFNTLCTEWYGKHVSKTNAETSTCESFSEVGNFNYYDMYQKYDEMNTDAFSATNNADGTMTVHINTSEVPGGLASLSCNYLKIKVTNAAQTEEYASVEYKVPIIVSGSKSTTDDIFDFEDCSICDVAILQGGTLTAATGGKNEVSDVEVYRGAKLSIPSGQEYTVNNLYLRSQGDIVPQLDVIGTLNRASTKLYFDKRVDESRWYWMTLPYNCAVKDVTLRSGETPTYGIGNTWVLQTYDGRKRANTQAGGCWEVFTGDSIQKGVGYILGITPKSGHDYVELRFPMKATAWDKDAARATISVPVMGTKGASEDVPVNHRGWNLVGNPYLTNYSKGHIGETTAGNTGTNAIPQGLLTEVIGEGFHYDGTTRYVNIPQDGGYSEYSQVAIGTQGLPPFMSYFIQVEGSDGVTSYVQFSNTLDQQNYAPVRRAPAEYAEEDNHTVWVPFNLTNNKGESDETTLLISNRFTNGYEMMDDLIKWRGDYYQYSVITTKPVLATRNNSGEMAFNALPDTSASVTGIPVNFFAAYAGDYTFSINGKYGLEEVKEAQLWDKTTGQYYDLLANDYSFSAPRGENTDRFKLFVRVERKKVPTDIDNLPTTVELSLMAIDKTLVLSGLTGATSVYVYDMSGKLLRSDYTSGSGGIWRTGVPATGVYFVRVNGINGQQTLRTIVK